MHMSRVVPTLLYKDAEKTIVWLCDACDLEEAFIY